MRKFVIIKYLGIVSLVICLSNISITIAQTPLTHEKKIYQAEDKKIYWNKNLPVYVKLSTSPEEASPSYLMKSDTSAKYTDPYYFDTEGANFIRTKWAVNKETKTTVEPKIEVLWEVYVDGVAPLSEARFSNQASSAVTNDQKYYKNDLETQLFAKDKVSGLDQIYFSINGSAYKEYTSPLKFMEEGEYTLSYYSVDKVGNTENAKVIKFAIDASVPQTDYSFSGDYEENTVSGRAKISLKATDAHSGVSKIFFSLDNHKEKVYEAPFDISLLSEGEHHLKFHSIDKVNNKEEEKELSFYVDKSAPMVNSDVIGDRYNANGKEYFSGRAKVKLIAVDNKAGVKDIFYAINGEQFKLYESPFYLTTNGSNHINFYAIDKVGNKSSNQVNKNQKGLMTYLDLTGPTLSHSFVGSVFNTRDTIFISPTTKINLKGADTESGMMKISYTLTGGEEKDYKEPFTIDKAGLYKLDYTGYDNVINSNSKTLYFVVDNSGPNIYSTFDGKALSSKTAEGNSFEVYPSHVALFISVTDKQLGYDKIYYSINGGPETLYTNPIHGFNRGKDYKIKVKALDKLGNISYDQVSFAIAE